MSEKNLEIIGFMETRKERSEQDGNKLDDYDMKRYCPNDRVVIECEIGDLVEYIQTVEELKKKYVKQRRVTQIPFVNPLKRN